MVNSASDEQASEVNGSLHYSLMHSESRLAHQKRCARPNCCWYCRKRHLGQARLELGRGSELIGELHWSFLFSLSTLHLIALITVEEIRERLMPSVVTLPTLWTVLASRVIDCSLSIIAARSIQPSG